MTTLHMSLKDLDETCIDSLLGLLGYLSRVNATDESDVLSIGARKYKRVTADEVQF